ncbi:T93 [Tupaiid betaherpesvirus 1]|uniref:T93 n=1 Tax=Tupaiid herpesvirus 1 (strain 1) TaxID=10397 RepID=Q997C6_TUHV1|nr:T93 [Tupaiid betaherpesvirus 1]AAK00703.1 T93 protein [Tupaiid betaherpesvirus 1]AAK57136.1 T93 [Tupaiid betaherpesvirus 1]
METHLCSELNRDATGDRERLPVHLFLTERTLPYAVFRGLRALHVRVAGAADAEWRRLAYQTWPRELLLARLVPNRLRGDERVRAAYGLATTVWLDCPGRVVVPTRLVRLRFAYRSARDSPTVRGAGEAPPAPAVADRDRDPVDRSFVLDFWVKDLLAAREPMYPASDDGDEVDRPAAAGHGGATATTAPDAVTAAAAAAAVADGGGLARFFHIDGDRKLSPSLKEYLDRFAGVRDGEAAAPGPLERPSWVRGRPSTALLAARRLEFLDAGDEKAVGSASRTARWFRVDNDLRPVPVQDAERRRDGYVFWYRESCCAPWTLTTAPDDAAAAAARESFERGLEAWPRCLLAVCEEVAERLALALRSGPELRQTLACHLAADGDYRALPDLLVLSRNVWLIRMDEDSCIIKALVEYVAQTDRSTRYCGRSDPRTEYWADVIDYSRCRVSSGLSLRRLAGPDGRSASEADADGDAPLLRLAHLDGRPAEWSADPSLCVLYVDRALNVSWALPGGFALTWRLCPDGRRHLRPIRERFALPAGFFGT